VSKKRALAMRRKHGKELCIPCEKKLHAAAGEKMLAPLNDPKQVAEYVKSKKANGGQAIVQALAETKDEIAV
jgi:hypothetical protein